MLRKTTLAGVSAAAALLLLAGCANQPSSTSTTSSGSGGSHVDIPAISSIDTPKDAVLPAGDGKAKCSGVTLAYVGAETGPNAQLGINIYNGVQLAINQHNKANPGCQVAFKKYDTEGDPQKATGPVTQAVNTKSIVGVIGLPFSGESQATGNIFQQAGLVHITPSATAVTLTQNGWTTFFRGLGNDGVQGPAAAKFLTGELKAKKVYVVQDDSAYGIGLSAPCSRSHRRRSGRHRQGHHRAEGLLRDGLQDHEREARRGLLRRLLRRGCSLRPAAGQGRLQGYFRRPRRSEGRPVRQAGRQRVCERVLHLPLHPGRADPIVRRRVPEACQRGSRNVLDRGLRRRHCDAFGHRPRQDDAPRPAQLGEEQRRQRSEQALQVELEGELQAPTVYGYKVADGKIVPIGVIGK